MRLLVLIGLIFAAPAAHAEPGAPPVAAVTAPAANASSWLEAGLDVRFAGTKGADQIECTVTQGRVTWREKVGGIATGCGPDQATVAKQFKAGKATLRVRTRLGERWSKPTAVPITFVKDAPHSAAPCPAPRCGPPAPDADATVRWPDGVKRGTSTPASWDASYEGRAVTGKSLWCPSAGSEDSTVDVKNGQLSFTVVLGAKGASGKSADPRARVRVKASVGADQSITGQSTLSADNLAFLAEGENAHGFPKGVRTLAVNGKAENVSGRGHGDLHQGRVLELTVTPSSGSVAGCTVTVRAADALHACTAAPIGASCNVAKDCCSGRCAADRKICSAAR